MQDSELLSAYALKGDEAAFGELVSRYVDLVFSTALRHLRNDSQLAEEVTQSVFLLLARKAAVLCGHPTLAGWLYRTAGHMAEKARRAEERRAAREWKAIEMNTTGPDGNIESILPELDGALGALNEPDRTAVLLRFFLKKPMREVGLAFGVSEAAAKMRVGRALDRLRKVLASRGVVCSASALALVLGARTVQAAPAALSSKILGSMAGTNSSLSFWTTKTLILMSQAKTTSVVLGIAALLALSVGVRHILITQSRENAGSEAMGGRSRSQSPTTAENTGAARVKRALSGPVDANASAVARLHASLAAPLPRSGISWPSEDVIRAVAQFGDKRAAFEALKSVILNPEDLVASGMGVADPARMIRDRALSAMQPLASDVPEVTPFLWEIFRTGDVSAALSAYTDLKTIGLKPADLTTLIDRIPELSRSPAFRHFVPQGIADVIARDPMAAAGAISALEQLLTSPEATVGLAAACALASSRLEQNPTVSEILRHALTSGDSLQARMSVEALAKAGPKAAPFVPAMLELANGTSDAYLRKDTLRAVAAIQPSATEALPEVARVLGEDGRVRELSARLDAGSATADDLVAALKLPQFSTRAAAQLGDLGPDAAKALPALRASLEGKDEDARDKILEAIYKIDPRAQIDRVDAKAMMEAVMHTEMALGAKGNNYEDPLTRLVMDRRAFSTWWTREEVVSFANRLMAMDKNIAQVFAANVIERDPAMREPLAAIH